MGNLLEIITVELRVALRPLTDAAAALPNLQPARELFAVLIDDTTVLSDDGISRFLSQVQLDVGALDRVLDGPAAAFRRLDILRDLFRSIIAFNFNGIRTGGSSLDVSDLGSRLVRLLTGEYLAYRFAPVHEILRLLQVIDYQKRVPTFHFERLSQFLQNPSQLGVQYGWGTAEFDLQELFARILDLARAFIFPADYDSADENEIQFAANERLEIVPYFYVAGGTGLRLLPLPPKTPNGTDAGFALVAVPTGDLQAEYGLYGGWKLNSKIDGVDRLGFGVQVRPNNDVRMAFLDGQALPKLSVRLTFAKDASETWVILPISPDTWVEAQRARIQILFEGGTERNAMIECALEGGSFILSPNGGDSFLQEIIPANNLRLKFDLALSWSSRSGLRIRGGGGLEATIPINTTLLDLLTVKSAYLAIQVTDKAISVVVATSFIARIGPIVATVEQVGLQADLGFPATGGSLGPADLALRFKLPNGIGLAIDADAVKGGGFLSHQGSRYAGAVELSVFDVKVKAFGVIDTVLPDGRAGYSFAIIISAEFTPIALGFGFTLNGVGGLIGINRGFDQKAFGDAVRAGTLGDILFPRTPEKDAPVILDRLAALFPPADGHYTFGPTAKIGWGTPTLIAGDFGIVLELPGPRVTVLGRIRARLPKPDKAIVNLNMNILATIDFPKKWFALDASLFDSTVGGYPVRGDMAFRLTWGDRPNFALAIGGFNPHYNPPPAFPKLRPVEIDLGITGNPSVLLSGYLALTSNTAQVGAKLDAMVTKGGATLRGMVGFDALFTFAPFSFIADLEGSVSVSFHGVGFSLHAHGTIEGPSPWKIAFEVCVSVLWWDVCVGVRMTLDGSKEQVALPEVPPWEGLPDQGVTGLQSAIADPRNWSAALPPGGFTVVTLAPSASGAGALLDPLGVATLRQKVVPFEENISRFAGRKLATARTYQVTQVVVGARLLNKDEVVAVRDLFARGQFQELSKDKLLSLPSFERMAAGVAVSSDRVKAGRKEAKQLAYRTFLFDAEKKPTELKEYPPSDQQVAGASQRSAVARRGIRLSGVERFFDPKTIIGVLENDEQFAPALKATLAGASNVTTNPAALSKGAVLDALVQHLASNPGDRGLYQVVQAFEGRKA